MNEARSPRPVGAPPAWRSRVLTAAVRNEPAAEDETENAAGWETKKRSELGGEKRIGKLGRKFGNRRR